MVNEAESDDNGETDYTVAVAYFRAALRQDPDSLLYLNDLGVTEMRMVGL